MEIDMKLLADYVKCQTKNDESVRTMKGKKLIMRPEKEMLLSHHQQDLFRIKTYCESVNSSYQCYYINLCSLYETTRFFTAYTFD